MPDLHAIEDTFGSFVTFRRGFGIDDDRRWDMPIRVFLATLNGASVLVDAGVGPPGGGSFMPERQGRLPAGLEQHGLGADDIDLVVFTHLHVDHVGWAVVDGELHFPNARYVAHEAEFDYFSQPDADPLDIRDRLIDLRGAGRIEVVEADGEIHPGVAIRHLPGHTPGHCGVEVGDVFVFGDAVVHELQLANPDQPFFAEADPVQAAAMRRQLLPELAESGVVVGSPHLPTPFGRIRRENGRFAWSPFDQSV
jgi:glyoxylase-like metal-dependent hydrolase (beta-lactamase superfamily II)